MIIIILMQIYVCQEYVDICKSSVSLVCKWLKEREERKKKRMFAENRAMKNVVRASTRYTKCDFDNE